MQKNSAPLATYLDHLVQATAQIVEIVYKSMITIADLSIIVSVKS